MKQVIKAISFKTFLLLIMTAFVQTMAWAQDSSSTSVTKMESTTSTTETTWYTEPWVWVVGGAVFLLLLVALIRGNSKSSSTRSDNVRVTKTIKTDRDV